MSADHEPVVAEVNPSNVRFLGDTFASLRADFPDFSDVLGRDLYSLPEPLIDAMVTEDANFFAQREQDFELALSTSLRRHHAVGVSSQRLICCSLFEERVPVRVSDEEFRALGWDKLSTLDQTNLHFEEAEKRAVQFHEQLVAYAGWLVTNPEFAKDVARLRELEREVLPRAWDRPEVGTIATQFKAFCAKWQLAGMASWDLPTPQGPELAGINVPAPAMENANAVHLRLSAITRLPSRFPIRDVIAEIAKEAAGPHLTEWQNILDHDGERGPGMRRFRHMLWIQFFRNVVLSSRYAERIAGRVQVIDRAFGTLLGGLSEDSVKKLRLEINRRLPVKAAS